MIDSYEIVAHLGARRTGGPRRRVGPGNGIRQGDGMTLTAGARLGPYEIGAALGAGGMAEVYRVKHERLRTLAPRR